MVVTDTEHPPAAGTALGLIIPGYSHYAVVFILSGALILSAMRFVLRPKMINLLYDGSCLLSLPAIGPHGERRQDGHQGRDPGDAQEVVEEKEACIG